MGYLKDSFTDSMGRPEPKMVLGFLFLIFDLVYAVLSACKIFVWSSEIFTSVAVVGTALTGVTAVADAINDKRKEK